MACYRPVRAYQTSSGEIRFSEIKDDFVRTLELPCGACIGCRLERSRQWAVRCLHESKLHKENCFLTLTYDDKHLPADGSLRYGDFQAFMKRFRKAAKAPLRFYMCGEYGELLKRPHYHACIFGYDFADKRLLSRNGGNTLYTSVSLDKLWSLGMCSIGSVTYQSAAYIARYIVDKITGDLADEHYQGRVPEFNRMSLKPGIGYGWFVKYSNDWYPKGQIVVDGKEVATPRYYDKLYARRDPYGYERLQYARHELGHSRSWDNTDERLGVREKVTKARFKFKEDM